MGKRKVTILDTASDTVAEAAFFLEGEGLPRTAKKFVVKPLNFLQAFRMIESNIIFVPIHFGKASITVVLLIKNMQ